MRKSLKLASVVFSLVFSQAEHAFASTFKVAPIKVYLTAQTPTSLLTLTNTSDQPLRFQISAFSWSQSRAGELELAPTEDIIFFPALLTLKAGEERNVRVGYTKRVAPPIEESFRIFFEELPSSEPAPENGAQIKVLTKMGIPIFVAPKDGTPRVAISQSTSNDRSLSFSVENLGNAHFTIRSVQVTGRDASGTELFSRQFDGWYILPRGARDYSLPVTAKECTGLADIDVKLSTDIVGEAASGEVVRWKAPAQLCQASN